MARTLILGGTRNLGHVTALALLEAGHEVAVLNRGQTPDELPQDIERLRGDRTDMASMRNAIGLRSFDLVLDNTTYTEDDARQAVSLFDGRTGRYIFISSGQVYLVRENLARPFRESDYDGPVMSEPLRETADYPAWLYGIEKRLAEQVLSAAFESVSFPVTTLRLPMVASERDHYGRIQGYVARMIDGGPLLIPDEQGLPLRHVYVNDVAQLVARLATTDAGIGRAYNISWGESMTLSSFLELLRDATESNSQIMRFDRGLLESEGLLPDCSPFSGRWMSELDNETGVSELGARYTSPSAYLPAIIADFQRRWTVQGLVPDSYRKREREIAFAVNAPR